MAPTDSINRSCGQAKRILMEHVKRATNQT